MAHVAIPHDDGCIGLDDLEGVLAVYWSSHCDVRRVVDMSECGENCSER